LLPLAEFVYNFNVYSFISKIPFKIIYTRILKLNIITFKKARKYFAKENFTEIKTLIKKLKFTREKVKTSLAKT